MGDRGNRTSRLNPCPEGDLVVPAYRLKGRRGDLLVIDCPTCGAVHTHGPPAGHRVPHCLIPDAPSYTLREVPGPVPEYLLRRLRTNPIPRGSLAYQWLKRSRRRRI